MFCCLLSSALCKCKQCLDSCNRTNGANAWEAFMAAMAESLWFCQMMWTSTWTIWEAIIVHSRSVWAVCPHLVKMSNAKHCTRSPMHCTAQANCYCHNEGAYIKGKNNETLQKIVLGFSVFSTRLFLEEKWILFSGVKMGNVFVCLQWWWWWWVVNLPSADKSNNKPKTDNNNKWPFQYGIDEICLVVPLLLNLYWTHYWFFGTERNHFISSFFKIRLVLVIISACYWDIELSTS